MKTQVLFDHGSCCLVVPRVLFLFLFVSYSGGWGGGGVAGAGGVGGEGGGGGEGRFVYLGSCHRTRGPSVEGPKC